MTFRVSYMTRECWETFRDGLTCSTNPHEILIGWELINSVTCLNTRFWLVLPPSSDYNYSHPYKINRDRAIELLAESMDANQELASDDPWAPLQISVGGPSSYIRDEFL